MKACRDLNVKIAQEVFGYTVSIKKKVWTETTPQGDRPLRNYSKDMEWAWTVAEKMKITLIPVVGNQWFAFAGPAEVDGWDSPEGVLKFLEAKNFVGGASVNVDPALAICEAAVNAVEKRKMDESQGTSPAETETETDTDGPSAAEIH